jgi:glutamate--cysteine ligase
MAGSARGEETPIHDLDQCLQWARSGSKPRDQFKIGTEFERIAVGPDGMALPYDGDVSIRALLQGLADRFGWEPFLEHGKPIALSRNGASVSLEPAGQFELSGAVLATVEEFQEELRQHLSEVAEVADPLGIRFAWVGLNPQITAAQAPHMPKGRYNIMRKWMPKVGMHGLDMMHLTCTVQTNLDYSSDEDAAELLRAGHLLSPVLLALFANSPYRHGHDTGLATYRGSLWRDVDPARCDTRRLAFERGTTLADHVQWTLDVPMYFVSGTAQDGSVSYEGLDGKTTFRNFFERGIDGRRPTMADWEVHVSTVFPDVRLKKWVEIRQADVVPPEALPALPALCKGLLYDLEARRAAMSVLGDGDERIDREALRTAACQSGLSGSWGGISLREWSQEILALARQGLERQAASTGLDLKGPAALDILSEIAHGQRPEFWRVTRDRLIKGGALLTSVADPA